MRPGLGHALAGDGGQRRERPLWARVRLARPPRRRAAAGDRDRRPARDAAGTRHLACAGAPAHGPRRDPGGRRAGAALPQPAGATRRSRSAAPAVTASTAPTAAPGWWSTASPATLECHHCGFQRAAAGGLPGLRGGGELRAPCGPGVERARRGGGRGLPPMPGGLCSPATRCAAPARCRTWSMPSWLTRSTC